jgi:Xaa-Pro aminopeptidase
MIIPVLDTESCRMRQRRFSTLLRELELDAAVLTRRGYIHALTGYWHRQPLTPVAAVVGTEGDLTLVSPEGSPRASAVDRHVWYQAQKHATLIEDPIRSLYDQIYPLLQDSTHVGFVGGPMCPRQTSLQWSNITVPYQRLRRAKDSDEVAILRFAIDVTERTLQEALTMLPERPTEIEIHAAMYGAALRLVGEPVSGWGNDFQSGSPGGLPRHRRPSIGEVAIFDVGIGVRGYRSDLCRSFVVGGDPSNDQLRAHARILKTISMVEDELRPGIRCLNLYERANAMLNDWHGYSFTHHLGHGIGLDAHEVPRLNPEWDDVLAEGDVVAVEPALYGDALKSGIRLENDYLITESGAERLSSFPLSL